MTVLVAIIGLLNLAVGFGLGVYLGGTADQLPLRNTRLAARIPYLGTGVKPDSDEDALDEDVSESEDCDSAPKQVGKDDIDLREDVDVENTQQVPDKWLAILEQHGVEVTQVIEATAEVLRLRIDPYRSELVRVDGAIRREIANSGADSTEIVSNLTQLNENWLSEQEEARSSLVERSKSVNEDGAVAERLLRLLDEQADEVRSVSDATAECASEDATPETWKALLDHVTSLFDKVHHLRDAILAALVEIKLLDSGLEGFAEHLQKDDLTALRNRGGLEKLFGDFFATDPHRQRQVSCIMLDIDQFRELNVKYGPVFADRVLAAFAGLFDHLLQKDHGFEVGARFAGQRFVAFLADTGPRNAMSLAEQMRQTIAATTFEWQQHSLDVSVSCGVVEFGPRDTTDSLYGRLESAVHFAKARGRDCTALDDGSGPDIVDPPHYEVDGRVLSLL